MTKKDKVFVAYQVNYLVFIIGCATESHCIIIFSLWVFLLIIIQIVFKGE